MRNQFTDVTRLAQGLVFNNFNSIQFGEPDLQNALSHNVSLFYSSFNLFNYTNVFAFVNADFELGNFTIAPALRLDYFKYLRKKLFILGSRMVAHLIGQNTG